MHGKGQALPAGWGGNYLPTVLPPLVYFGVATLADARSYGYRLPEPDPTTTAHAPTVPQNVLTAFYGTPSDTSTGCLHQAVVTLNIDQATEAYSFVQTLRLQAITQTRQDSGLKAANTAWSTCMKAAGYDYPNPLTASQDKTLLGRGLPTPPGAALPPPSPIEKHVATIDVTCKQKTDYEQTYTRILAGHQRQLIEANTAGLQHVLTEWQDVLHEAAITTART
ncbi:hypothetical protein GXW82_43290 [Streptacidiphilus sp. 4-A2]|nr:hypothetical protein [Streptacidiphilus sp. 4-A2]